MKKNKRMPKWIKILLTLGINIAVSIVLIFVGKNLTNIVAIIVCGIIFRVSMITFVVLVIISIVGSIKWFFKKREN